MARLARNTAEEMMCKAEQQGVDVMRFSGWMPQRASET
jgi:hypothetical protein